MKVEDTKTKAEIAEQLRAYAGLPVHQHALAAIDALGELGGQVAIRHIEELMDAGVTNSTPSGQEKWAALLRAYGRAARNLTD